MFGVDYGVSGFFVLISLLLGDSLFGLGPHSFEHGGVLEHRRHYHESDLTAAKVDLLDGHRSAVFVEHGNIIESDVHGVFGVGEETSEHLSGFHFDCNDVMFGFVKQFNGSTDHLFFIRECTIYILQNMDFILAHSRFKRRKYPEAI